MANLESLGRRKIQKTIIILETLIDHSLLGTKKIVLHIKTGLHNQRLTGYYLNFLIENNAIKKKLKYKTKRTKQEIRYYITREGLELYKKLVKINE